MRPVSRFLSVSRVIVGMVFTMVAAPAVAQPNGGTLFMGGGAFASVERSSRSSGIGIDADHEGTVAGGGLQLGVYLTPHVSARFEWSLTDWLTYDEPGIYPLITPDILAMPAGGPGRMPAAPTFAPQGFEGRSRAKAGFALLGYRLGARRASVELLGGMGWVSTTTRTAFDVRVAQAVIDLLPFARETRYSSYDTVAVAGLDATVPLTEHAAVVPQVRVFGLDGGLSLRPGVGVRWTF